MTYTDQQIEDAITALVDRGENKAQAVRLVLHMLRVNQSELVVPAGSKYRFGAGAPAAALGNEGDVYDNILTGDRSQKLANGTWGFQYNAKGAPGRTPQKGVDYQDGYTPRKGTDYRDGQDGKSTYQLWLEAGNTGTVAAFLAAQKGEPGVSPGNETTVADGSITNDKLATDVKVGSLSAAANAYPAPDRAGLTTVERFLVWIGPKISDLFTRVGALDGAMSALSSVVGGFSGRIQSLEARPTGATAGTAPGSGTANYPAQSPATAGKFLSSTGAAGGEAWATPTNNRVSWVLSFKNEVSRNQRFFKATALVRVQKDAGISTLSYSINGATPVLITFTADAFAPATALVFPAGALLTWSLTYNTNFTEAAFEVEGTEAA